jgi:hypothetical protein
MTSKYIHFHNNSNLPVMIDSWVDGSNSLQNLRVGPREKLIIHSSVGEWHINAMFYDSEDRKIWDENSKLKKVLTIGKFRSEPCARGNYSWLDYDNLFDCVYKKLDDEVENVKGLITFSANL